MSESDPDIDEVVASLPEQTLRRIDEAFDHAISESRIEDYNSRPRKRRRISQHGELELAGGFLLDDSDGNDVISKDLEDSGGFVAENEEDNEDNFTSLQPTHILLTLIPHALQLFDLDPSDAQVLSVFRDAASSWTDEGSRRKSKARIADLSGASEDAEAPGPEQVVSRRDWRAVCAALMPTPRPVSSPLTSAEESNVESRSAPDVETDSSSSAAVSDDSIEDDLSEDEYVPTTRGIGKSRGQRNKVSSSKSRKPRKSVVEISSGRGPKSLTVRQVKDTVAAFALFFPSQPKGSRTNLTEEELVKKKLTIRDVANAAASIKEKITAEEIIEMLNFFSPSSSHSNPSMTYEEFQQMMITARLA